MPSADPAEAHMAPLVLAGDMLAAHLQHQAQRQQPQQQYMLSIPQSDLASHQRECGLLPPDFPAGSLSGLAGFAAQVHPMLGNAACWRHALLAQLLAGWHSCSAVAHIFQDPLRAFGVWALLHASLGKAGIPLSSILITAASITGSLRQWGKQAAAPALKQGAV